MTRPTTIQRTRWDDLLGPVAVGVPIVLFDARPEAEGLAVEQHPLTVHAFGSKMSDAIKRSIDVLPDGKMVEQTASGRLKGTVEETIQIPEQAIDDASKLLVKVYPGIFSQAVEGLDSMLRMPFGCFEQTSSVT